MASNSRFGWHSGVMKCKEARVLGDLKIQKNLIFGDVSFGELAITGRVVTSSEAGANIVVGSTHAYAEGFELRYSVDSWAGIGTTSTFQGIYLRVQNNVDAASASLRGLSVVTYSNAYNTAQIEGAFFETGVKSISGNKTVGPIYGMESQISIYNATSGTLTITEQTNVGIAAGRFQLGLGSGLADYTCVYGIIIQTNDASVATRTLGSGILLRNYPVEGTQTWTIGIDIQSACTTSIDISGTADTGISFSGTCTTGIDISDSSTKGIAIGASATGIYIYGCTDQSIFVGQAMTDVTKPVEFYGLATSTTKGSTQGVLQVYMKREQVMASSDGNPDTALKIKAKNEENNTTSVGGLRGIDLEVQNEETNASTSFIHGAMFTAANSSDVSTACADMQVLQCMMSNQGIVTSKLYGIRVLENSEGTIPTDTVGIKVTTSTNAPATGTRADGIMVTTGGGSGGWTDGIHIAGTITNAINIAGTHTVGITIGGTIEQLISGTSTVVASGAGVNVNSIVVNDASDATEVNGYYTQMNTTGDISGAKYRVAGNFRIRAGGSAGDAAATFSALWASIGITGSATPTLGNMSGLYVYGNALTGATVSQYFALDLNMNCSVSVVNVDGYIRCYNHGGASPPNAIIWMANSGDGTADYLLDFEAAVAPFIGAHTHDNDTYEVKCRMGTTDCYLKLYT